MSVLPRRSSRFSTFLIDEDAYLRILNTSFYRREEHQSSCEVISMEYVYTVHLYTVQCTQYNVHCTLYIEQPCWIQLNQNSSHLHFSVWFTLWKVGGAKEDVSSC